MCYTERNQATVSLSTYKADLIALTNVNKEFLWLKRVIVETAVAIDYVVPVHSHNLAAIRSSKGEIRYSNRGIHVDVKLHLFSWSELLNEVKVT